MKPQLGVNNDDGNSPIKSRKLIGQPLIPSEAEIGHYLGKLCEEGDMEEFLGDDGEMYYRLTAKGKVRVEGMLKKAQSK